MESWKSTLLSFYIPIMQSCYSAVPARRKKNCSILNPMCFLHCLNRREGGTVTPFCIFSAFYLAELDQFGSNGILKVTTTLILYTNHAKLLVMQCPQEGSRRKGSTLNCMFVLHRLNVCYGKLIYYFAAPMTDTTAIFGSVTSHRLDIWSCIHLRRTWGYRIHIFGTNMSYPNGPQHVLWHHRREGGNTTL